MKANVIRDAQGNIVVQMQGDLNYEHSLPLRQELQAIMKDSPNTNITIDLSGIDFVGSSGICHFVETLKILKQDSRHNVSLSNVKSEFVRVFKLYSLEEADELAAQMNFDDDETETLNTTFGNRSRTFQN